MFRMSSLGSMYNPDLLGFYDTLVRKQFPPRESIFWKNKPIRPFTSKVSVNSCVDSSWSIEGEERMLPSDLEWGSADVTDPKTCQRVSDFLSTHHTNEGGMDAQTVYTPDLVQWMLVRPKYDPETSLLLQEKETQEIVGFMGTVWTTLRIHEEQTLFPHIVCLCIHKSYRKQGLAIQMYVQLAQRIPYPRGIGYTTRYIPRPVCGIHTFMRPLQIEKMIRLGMIRPSVDGYRTEREILIHHTLPETVGEEVRPMRMEDIPYVVDLLNRAYADLTLATVFDASMLKHLLSHSRAYAYVIESESNVIKDCFAFHVIDVRMKGSQTETSSTVQIACADHLFCTGHVQSLRDVFQYALIKAKQYGADVYQALDTWKHLELFACHQFKVSRQTLYQYVFNWKVAMRPLRPCDMFVNPYF